MSDNAVMERPTHAVAEQIDGRKIKEYMDAFGLSKDLTANEAKQFTEIAQAFQLNPFKREIYCVPYGDGEKRRLSIITGYEVYLKRAERIGKLTGWKAWTEGDVRFVEKTKPIKTKNGGTWNKTYRAAEGNMRALVEIHRADWKAPFVHEVFLDEYYQDNEMWGSKPRTMLKKVAIAQAFRLAFPDEMGGMPYTKDELPDEMVNVTEPTAPAPTEPAVPEKRGNNVEDAVTDALGETPPPPPKTEPTPEAKVFNALLETIAQNLAEKDDAGVPWFTDAERKPYREEAQEILKIRDRDEKLRRIKDLSIKVQGALFQKKDDRAAKMAELDEAADEGFREDGPELGL